MVTLSGSVNSRFLTFLEKQVNQVQLKTLFIGITFLMQSAAYAASNIKIGFMTTLSGPGAVIGQEMKDGFALGIKHSGDKLGGLSVDLQIADDQQSPDAGRQVVERFLKRDKVDVMTGVVFSNVLLPILPAVLATDTVYISANTGPADYAGAKCNRNFFSVASQNEDIPQAVGKFAVDKNYKRVAMIAPNYPGGRELISGFKRQYKGTIAEELYTRLGQLDFAAELATIRAAKPDAIYFFLPGGMGVNFIKQFEASGMAKQVDLLAPGFSADEDTIKATGEAIVGVYNGSHWTADLPNPANEKFVADFVKTYGRTPTMYAAQAYDAALLIDSAVAAVAGRIEDRDAFRAALRKGNFKSVRGAFRFNNNQFPVHNLYLRVVQKTPNGKITNKLLSTVLVDHSDSFAASCPMK